MKQAMHKEIKQIITQAIKHAWSIFRQDLNNIKRVPLMGLLLIGLAFLPSLYAWVNLSASWEPCYCLT